MAIKKNRNVDQAYAHNLHLGLLREIKEGRAVPSPDISPEARKKYEKIKKILNNYLFFHKIGSMTFCMTFLYHYLSLLRQ